MIMGLVNMIKNIAQVGWELACKTFVDHDIQMVRAAIVELLPPKGVEQ